MKTPSDKSKYLKKLIDIPKEIVVDLKKLAIEDDKSFKVYIESVLVERVNLHRGKSNGKPLSGSRSKT